MILELIYCCCVMCTDVWFSCASQKYRVWAEADSWHGHEVFTMNWWWAKPWKKSAKKLPFWPYAVPEHVKGKGKTELHGAGEAFSRMGVAEFRMQQGTAQCAACRSLFPVPTGASWEGSCLQSPCSSLWNQTTLRARNASCFSSLMVN